MHIYIYIYILIALIAFLNFNSPSWENYQLKNSIGYKQGWTFPCDSLFGHLKLPNFESQLSTFVSILGFWSSPPNLYLLEFVKNHNSEQEIKIIIIIKKRKKKKRKRKEKKRKKPNLEEWRRRQWRRRSFFSNLWRALRAVSFKSMEVLICWRRYNVWS